MTIFLIILSVISCLVVSLSVSKLNEAFDDQCILNSRLEFIEKTTGAKDYNAIQQYLVSTSNNSSDQNQDNSTDSLVNDDNFINTRKCLKCFQLFFIQPIFI